MDSKTKRAVIFLIICILVTCVNHWISNEYKESTIKEYEIIIVDGVEYKTQDIDYITKDYTSDGKTIVIIMNDGTKIYAKTYTLKDKGE